MLVFHYTDFTKGRKQQEAILLTWIFSQGKLLTIEFQTIFTSKTTLTDALGRPIFPSRLHIPSASLQRSCVSISPEKHLLMLQLSTAKITMNSYLETNIKSIDRLYATMFFGYHFLFPSSRDHNAFWRKIFLKLPGPLFGHADHTNISPILRNENASLNQDKFWAPFALCSSYTF